MYELIQVSDKAYYVESPAKIGLVRLDGDQVCLIDSGNDKDAGKKVYRILEANGWKLAAIYNTHSHADHIGGNQFLQNKTGCRIYAPGIEECFTDFPVLESAFLYGGYPHSGLRHKFLMAKESRADALTPACLPESLTAVPLPGHSFDMVGFRTDEDVLYLADCLFSEETLEKYHVSFIYDVKSYLETLQAVCGMEAKIFIPAHAPATENILPLAEKNIAKVLETADIIRAYCAEPAGFEDILQRVFTVYQLEMNLQQHVLVGSTVRSFLSWLTDRGELEMFFEDNRLFWRQK